MHFPPMIVRGRTGRGVLALLIVLAAVLTAPAWASAVGTGDDPTREPDTLTRGEAKTRRGLESRMRAEEAGRGPAKSGSQKRGKDTTASITSEGFLYPPGLPRKYLWTPTHTQERSYWCGPATVQVIDDYFGRHASQYSIARYLGTTRAGTVFSRVDDALRYFTGKPYYYYGGLNEAALWRRVEHSLLAHGQPLALDVKIRGSVWPYYVYDHAGHIVPLEAFDWRYARVRLNDVYPENRYRRGGGATLGHRTYPRWVIWDGIRNHWRRAVVAAP